MAEQNKTLVERIAAAGLDVGGKLQPDKKNAEQKYDYISADKILAMCGQALFQQGITVFPGVTSREISMFEYTDQYGKQKRRYDATVIFSMTVSAGKDEAFTCMWAGAGSDYSVPDKAVYKAITSGHKYFLMKLLNIGAGNEDAEHEDEPTGKTNSKPAQPAKANGNGKPAVVEAAQAMDAVVTQTTTLMGLEMAEAVTNSEGIRYGEIDSEKLSHMSASIIKALKTAAPEQREAYELKRDAIATILAARAAQTTE